MSQIILSFLFAVLGAAFGTVFTLFIEKKRLPKIEIIAVDRANADHTYESGPHKGERWKFFRLAVINKKITPFFSWLVIRQTAENCRVTINIKGMDNPIDISFKGRWASTPEIPHLGQNAVLKLFEPDPVTIPEDHEEFLDVIVKYENDKEGYGWNNEAYFHDWRTPHYKLNPGRYQVQIKINTQNGISFLKIFLLTVGERIEDTRLS
ncbi:MAG: hypothetical protein WC600_15315 [Desulfobaccales bacterium]